MKNKQAEMSRRGAAAMARATAGRSRTIDSKKRYRRKEKTQPTGTEH